MTEVCKNKVAILCGGGPAPGINSVIRSITIGAENEEWEVLGIYDGFARISKGEKSFVQLTADMVDKIHFRGGSVLGISRFNPTVSDEYLKNAITILRDAGVTHLVTIGGDDTAYSASKLSGFARSIGVCLNVAHVPKTIDNDLPLPEGVPTFGFETARSLGVNIVSNLMEDAQTTGRWYFVMTMGRTTGHLAVAIGKSAGVDITLIPEEFADSKVHLGKIADILTGAIIKRLAAGKKYGVAVIAEGIIEKIEQTELSAGACLDDHGHIRYAEINFIDMLKQMVVSNLQSLGIKMTIVSKEIGYELRCAPPNAFDIEYTCNLGYAAFKFLREGGTDAVITFVDDKIVPLFFSDILDRVSGRTQIRRVNIESMQYLIARNYMTRLEKNDFESTETVEQLAKTTNLSLENFINKFKYTVE